MRRLLLDESHDIARVQLCESHRAGTKTIGKKPTNEWHVVDDRSSGQSARIAQVLRILMRVAFRRCRSTRGDLLGGDHALAAEKI